MARDGTSGAAGLPVRGVGLAPCRDGRAASLGFATLELGQLTTESLGVRDGSCGVLALAGRRVLELVRSPLLSLAARLSFPRLLGGA